MKGIIVCAHPDTKWGIMPEEKLKRSQPLAYAYLSENRRKLFVDKKTGKRG